MPARHVRIPDDVPAELAAGIAALQTELKVPQEFPAEVQAAAERLAGRDVLADDPQGRRWADRTDIDFVTIDPLGAKDLDQALHIARSGDGFVVHYAIAHVAAFVQPGDPIDAEARRRGQTLYAPNRRTPLHPAELSENVASLLEGQVRPALLWTLSLDARGEVTAAEVALARVRSRQQLTYEQVQTMIDNGTASQSLQLLKTVGELRLAREADRGGVSLNIPEQEVRVEGGRWIPEFREPLPVEGWNAQISLMTGMAAARIMIDGRIGVLRTLPPAQPKDLDQLRRTARALKIDWPAQWAYPQFVRSLDPAIGSHRAMLYSCTSLFRGAGYVAFDGQAPEHADHAAMAAAYAHCTAPLRRLVDRFVGEVCLALVAGREVDPAIRAALPELPEIMAESDRRAKKFERGVVDLVEALVLAGREGEQFTATVVSVDPARGRGRVVIADPAVEVTVTGAALPLGEEIRVRLDSVDLKTGVTAFTRV